MNMNDFSYKKVPILDSDDPLEMQRQVQMKRQEQNQSLDLLGESVTRLGNLSLSISKEIDDQNRMLDELQDDIDTAQDGANRLTKTTAALVKAAGGWHCFWLITFLIVVLVILTLAVIYT